MPPTVNQLLLDEAVRHAVRLERFKNHEVREIVGMLNRDVLPGMEEELLGRLLRLRGDPNSSPAAARRLADAIDRVRELSVDGAERVGRRAKTDFENLAMTEAEWQAATLRRTVPIAVDWKSPAEATLKSIVRSKPMEGQVLGDWFSDLGRNTARRVSREVNAGVAAGEPTEKIVRRLRGSTRAGTDGVLDVTRREAESIVRTAANHVSSHAREETYKENSSAVGRVKFVATLDSRTTLQCAGLDGKTFEIGKGPRPPLHWACRSTTVPVVKKWSELGIPGLKEPPPAVRSAMDGEAPGDQAYPEWLRGQSREFQDEALGPGRAIIFRRGRLPLDKFTDDRGQTLTLVQLRKLEGLQ